MTNDARSSAQPISMAALTSLVLGIAALILLPVAPGLHPIALVLAIAAILIGVVAVVNARGIGAGGRWLALAGVALGIVAAVIVAIVNFL